MTAIELYQPAANLIELSTTAPAFAGLVTASSFIGADVALTTANQFYQVTTLSLTAGTWIVFAQCQFYSSAAGATQYTMRVVNSTSGVTLGESSSMHPSQATGTANANVSAIVTLTAAATITMQATSATSARTVRYLGYPSGTYNATGLCAVRVSP